MNHFEPRNLDWAIGGHSPNPFEPMWHWLNPYDFFFWVSDGNKVYPRYIPDGDQIVSKTYMTRVGRREYSFTSLSGSSEAQNIVLFEVHKYAETFHSIVNSLSEALGCSYPTQSKYDSFMIHPVIQ